MVGDSHPDAPPNQPTGTILLFAHPTTTAVAEPLSPHVLGRSGSQPVWRVFCHLPSVLQNDCSPSPKQYLHMLLIFRFLASSHFGHIYTTHLHEPPFPQSMGATEQGHAARVTARQPSPFYRSSQSSCPMPPKPRSRSNLCCTKIFNVAM